MVQPPADVTLGDAIVIHYTWGPIISINGTEVWRFDKRAYEGNSKNLVKIKSMPPWSDNMRLQAGEVVTRSGYDLMLLEMLLFNRAVDDLPPSTLTRR
jgi:hypothetical protein